MSDGHDVLSEATDVAADTLEQLVRDLGARPLAIAAIVIAADIEPSGGFTVLTFEREPDPETGLLFLLRAVEAYAQANDLPPVSFLRTITRQG